jgi:DNA helicase HerA-like ATPase
VNALGRFLLNKSKNREFINKPLIVILDEAHLFLNNKVRDEYFSEVQLDSFDRIAKECRKF